MVFIITLVLLRFVPLEPSATDSQSKMQGSASDGRLVVVDTGSFLLLRLAPLSPLSCLPHDTEAHVADDGRRCQTGPQATELSPRPHCTLSFRPPQHGRAVQVQPRGDRVAAAAHSRAQRRLGSTRPRAAQPGEPPLMMVIGVRASIHTRLGGPMAHGPPTTCTLVRGVAPAIGLLVRGPATDPGPGGKGTRN